MILPTFDYAIPANLDEAITLLKANTRSKPLAGGQSLLVKMKLRQSLPTLLIDLRAIPQLSGIQRTSSGELRLGAMTPLVVVAEDPTIQQSYPIVIEALKGTADPQIRNRGTVGGSIVSDEVSPPLLAVALALDATMQITNPAGTRMISVSDFIAQPLSGRLAADEIMTAIYFPVTVSGSGSAYEQFKQSAAIPSIRGIAATVIPASNGVLQTCRIAAAGMTKESMHLSEIETALQGRELTVEAIDAAFHTYKTRHGLSPLAASAEYQAHLAHMLTKRALIRAWQQT